MARLLAPSVFLVCVLSVAVCWAAGPEKLEENKAWQADELKKFAGRWTTHREETDDKGQVRRSRMDLEFADGKLKVMMFDEKDVKIWSGPPLKVIGVEQVGERKLASRLKLERGVEIYYDFVGDRMILVGEIRHRPFEGFKLSGEYQRSRNAKAPSPGR